MVPERAVPLTPNRFVSVQGRSDAMTAPAPMKKTWSANPRVRCSAGMRSVASERKGCIATFKAPVSSHSAAIAISREAAFAIVNMPNAVRPVPTAMKGLRRPHGPSTRSLQCPTIGWTSRPVIGAAAQRSGSWAVSAPSVWNIRLVLTFCKPQTI